LHTQRKVAIKHLHNFAIPARAMSAEPCACFNLGKMCTFDERASRCSNSACNAAVDVCFCHIAPTLIRVLREISVLKELRAHPNVLKIVDIFPPTTVLLANKQLQTISELYIVFNYAGCNLETYMARCRQLSEAHVRSIMRQLLSAVGFLHRCRVVHRDIKPQNILISCKCSSSSAEHRENVICSCSPLDLEVVLADFGLCRIVEPSAASVLSPTLSPQRRRSDNSDQTRN
jgi:serine/threonine protein kinase